MSKCNRSEPIRPRTASAQPGPVHPSPARPSPAHPGRRPVTDRRRLERVAVGLFAQRGFERTTIDDIAAAAGIGRRTFFRYFGSKNDVIWGEFDAQLMHMREEFAS